MKKNKYKQLLPNKNKQAVTKKKRRRKKRTMMTTKKNTILKMKIPLRTRETGEETKIIKS
jgi:hypothetical protein